MNVLKPEKQLAVVAAPVEGVSIRSIERLTGVHRDTVMRLLLSVGEHCVEILDGRMRGLCCQPVQVDPGGNIISACQRLPGNMSQGSFPEGLRNSSPPDKESVGHG